MAHLITFKVATSATVNAELVKTCNLTLVNTDGPLFPLNRFSSHLKLVRVTAWVMRFLKNCRSPRTNAPNLSVEEITRAENYWLSYSQVSCFGKEIENLKMKKPVSSSSPLTRLHPFLDTNGLLRISGRTQKSNSAYSAMHPVILSGNHQADHTVRTHSSLSCWNLSATLFSQWQIPHNWWSKSYS